MRRLYSFLSICVAGLVLAVCNFTPDLVIPDLDSPMQYNDFAEDRKLTGVKMSNRKIEDYWWEDFGDENLSMLVEEALRNNTDYAAAVSRVAQARAALGIANADRFPTLSWNGATNKIVSGENPQSIPYSLSAVISYEVDLWGRVRESNRAAVATLLSVAANQENVRLSVIAGVIDSYFSLLSLEEQYKILQATVQAYNETYQYYFKQYEAGSIEEILLQQSRVQLESARANLYAITRSRSEVMSALALLVGRTPRGIFAAEFVVGELLPKAPIVPLAMPSTLIANRPDIKMAEENLRAANHSIGVAYASYFPVLSLSALGGLSARDIGDLFDDAVVSLSANISGPLFDFGRTENRVRQAEEAKEEALILYRAAVARAFAEVRDALVARDTTEKRLRAVEAQAQSQGRVYEIAKQRFEAGYSTHLELLDAERNWLSVQLNLSSAKADLLSSSLSLYKSLGGGFNARTLERETLFERP